MAQVTLIPFAPQFQDLVRTWRNLPEVARYMYTTDPIPADVHAAWFRRQMEGGDRRAWIIAMDDRPVGSAFISGINPENRHATWAFYLADPATRGQGVGGAVEYLVLEYAFGTLGLHKLCCEVLSFNAAVVAMHRTHGFEQEGVLREHYWRDGQWVDVHVLALSEGRWRQLREGFGAKLMARGLIAAAGVTSATADSRHRELVGVS